MDNKESDVDSMPYTTLLYANGPGYNRNFPTGRENLTGADTGKIFEIWNELLYVPAGTRQRNYLKSFYDYICIENFI